MSRMELDAAFEETIASLNESMGRWDDRTLPYVTVSYAQSLDGCISSARDERLSLSGREAFELTHGLRASHDAILVGIGTVIADDPLLTVRLVSGDDPQPVILDSRLRFPAGSRLARENLLAPWIFTTPDSDPVRKSELGAAGARIVVSPPDRWGRIDAARCLEQLCAEGMRSVMVEGGAGIITAFLSLRLANKVIITVTPLIVGGVHAVGDLTLPAGPNALDLHRMSCRRLADDVIITADVKRD